MSIDPKFVELTADVFKIFILNTLCDEIYRSLLFLAGKL